MSCGSTWSLKLNLPILSVELLALNLIYMLLILLLFLLSCMFCFKFVLNLVVFCWIYFSLSLVSLSSL